MVNKSKKVKVRYKHKNKPFDESSRKKCMRTPKTTKIVPLKERINV